MKLGDLNVGDEFQLANRNDNQCLYRVMGRNVSFMCVRDLICYDKNGNDVLFDFDLEIILISNHDNKSSIWTTLEDALHRVSII